MNDVTMPHVLSTLGNLSRVIEWYCLLRKTLCTTSSVSENWITFCEINNLSRLTDNIDGYIIKNISNTCGHRRKRKVASSRRNQAWFYENG